MREGGEIMKRIYISIPITGQECTYEQRLDAAVEYVKKMYQKYKIIITQKRLQGVLKITNLLNQNIVTTCLRT